MMAEISVVVVSYKGYERLKQCLDSLKTFTGEKVSCEVIVVNNCPGDTAFTDLARDYPGYRFEDNKLNGGYSNGCNYGVSFSSGNYILILNPDTVVTEDSVVEMYNIASAFSSFAVTSCRQVNSAGRESIAWGPFPRFRNLTGFLRMLPGSGYRSQVRFREGFPGDIFFPDWVSGSVMLIRRNDYEMLNGFDEDFWMYSEDVDLCRRVKNAGKDVAFCRHITIEHNHGGSSRINKTTAAITKTEVYISRHLYFSKHTMGVKKLMIQIFMVINNLLSAGITALAGMIFFFVPKINLRTIVFYNLVSYYFRSLQTGKWISKRSVNYTGGKS